MPRGPRGWVRAVCAGVGAVLCAGAIGCNGMDKPKDTKQAINTKVGLPGTPTLPQTGTGVAGARFGQQPTGQFNGMGNTGIQQTGGVAYPPQRQFGQPNYNTGVGTGGSGFGVGGTGGAGGSVIPPVGPAGAGYQNPYPQPGAGGGMPQPGFTGVNTPGAGTTGAGFASNPPAPSFSDPFPPAPPGGGSVSVPGTAAMPLSPALTGRGTAP